MGDAKGEPVSPGGSLDVGCSHLRHTAVDELVSGISAVAGGFCEPRERSACGREHPQAMGTFSGWPHRGDSALRWDHPQGASKTRCVSWPVAQCEGQCATSQRTLSVTSKRLCDLCCSEQQCEGCMLRRCLCGGAGRRACVQHLSPHGREAGARRVLGGGRLAQCL